MALQLINYCKNLAKTNDENKHLLPWGSVILRNCDDTGDLVTFQNVTHFREEDQPLWVLLVLVLFRENGNLFSVYACRTCPSMEGIQGMHMNQREEDVRDLQCVHAKAAMKFFPRWEDHWTIADMEDTDQSYFVFCNQDIRVQTLSQEGCFLAAIQSEGEITLLFTVGKKQKFPLCSRAGCSRKVKCICYKKYKAILREEEGSEDDEDQGHRYYWNRRSGPKPSLVEHFLDDQDENYIKKHGYNRTKFEYPIKRNRGLQEKFQRRLISGSFDLPDSFVSPYDDTEVCEKHGNTFDPDNDKLLLLSNNITIYTESCDKILPITVFGRPTIGGCKCISQADTHDLLLWNMGSGNLVDYLFLHNQVHKTVTSGSAMNATFNARKTALGSIGLSSSLSYPVFRRACTGYTKMIQFRKEDFLCSNCGDSPSYIVCDGKTEGPNKRQVSHIEELDRCEGDDAVLCQGSYFQDRVFLSENRERKLTCDLLTKSMTVYDFVNSDQITSDNGTLVKNLVERISNSWPDDIPKPYHRFIANISKYTSVAGYLQVTGPEALDIMANFCKRYLDIRSVDKRVMLNKVASELPALWPNILDILNLEKLKYLPPDVSRIILKLIKIRKNTFENAAVRNSSDYVDWEDNEKEHETQFYPNWPIFRFPKKYDVRNVTDCDFFEKNFNKHRDFSHGIFSVGCACAVNITYGFELMLCRESAHNIFRLLMCRDLNLHELKGVIFDHSCGLDQYLLNREPREFEFLRCLVDGAHWQVCISISYIELINHNDFFF